MNIGIDARLWQETGVGRYIRALVTQLGQIDSHNHYSLFLTKSDFDRVKAPNERWQKILADVHWHTVNEQLLMPRIYRQAQLDLLHIPYFSVPLSTPQPFVVTIHDLIISHFATGLATTRIKPIYFAKRLGYQLVLRQAISRAQKIITVSNIVKQQIVSEFGVKSDKVIVTLESGELENIPTLTQAPIAERFLLYVGNAYPHKNLRTLITAFVQLKKSDPNLRLVLIGKPDYFYESLKTWAKKMNYDTGIVFAGDVYNQDLANWYKHATLLVFPSLAEGFGIPGLEAMSLGCPVVASDISIFHEIYNSAALFFDPTNPKGMVETIERVIKNETLRQKLITVGKNHARKFSWATMAGQTLTIYENCTRL